MWAATSFFASSLYLYTETKFPEPSNFIDIQQYSTAPQRHNVAILPNTTRYNSRYTNPIILSNHARIFSFRLLMRPSATRQVSITRSDESILIPPPPALLREPNKKSPRIAPHWCITRPRRRPHFPVSECAHMHGQLSRQYTPLRVDVLRRARALPRNFHFSHFRPRCPSHRTHCFFWIHLDPGDAFSCF